MDKPRFLEFSSESFWIIMTYSASRAVGEENEDRDKKEEDGD